MLYYLEALIGVVQDVFDRQGQVFVDRVMEYGETSVCSPGY